MSSGKRSPVIMFLYLKKIKTAILFGFCEDFILVEFLLRRLPLFRKTKLSIEHALHLSA